MFLKESKTGHLVEILNLPDLFDPFQKSVEGRYNIGEDLPPPNAFAKAELSFPSDEPLPRCWLDPHYRD
jgi:hypothetical protein